MSTGTDAESSILLEMETEHRALLTLNRPDRLNTLTLDMWPRMSQLAGELDSNDSARVAILTGKGDRAFSAGLDLAPSKPAAGSGSRKGPRRSTAQKNRQTAQLIQRTSSHFTAFENLRIPTIAAINGARWPCSTANAAATTRSIEGWSTTWSSRPPALPTA